MEETETKGKRRGPCLPLEQRLRVYGRVLQLREQGLSYRLITETIHRFNGVRLSESTIKQWVRGLNSPLGNVNEFDSKPSPTLAYVIGVRLGDGYLCKYGVAYEFKLEVIDKEFTAETGRSLAKLLGRDRTYRPRSRKGRRCWYVKCRSVLLYRFLQRPWQKLRSYVEYKKACVALFLRAFFDGEANINGKTLTVYNTDEGLLRYVQRLLRQYFGIETTGPRTAIRAGHRFPGRNGKIYRSKKTCYKLYVRVDSLTLFRNYIGFTIKRKQRRLIEATPK